MTNWHISNFFIFISFFVNLHFVISSFFFFLIYFLAIKPSGWTSMWFCLNNFSANLEIMSNKNQTSQTPILNIVNTHSMNGYSYNEIWFCRVFVRFFSYIVTCIAPQIYNNSIYIRIKTFYHFKLRIGFLFIKLRIICNKQSS